MISINPNPRYGPDLTLTLTQPLIPTPSRSVASMSVAPDGTAMATSGFDGLVKVWVGSA